MHRVTDTGQHLSTYGTRHGREETAEAWVLTLAESCLRQMISETSTASIVSKQASRYLDFDGTQLAAHAGPATPDQIGLQLHSLLAPKVAEYGLEVNRIEMQEVLLPPAIQEAVDHVWIASTQPAKADYESRAQKMRLERVAEVLGVEATAKLFGNTAKR